MPAALTHKSIFLLARERIRQVKDVLQARLDAGRALTDLEHRLLFLARRAFDMTSGPPTPPLADSDPLRRRFGDVNKFAVMGSMGPDITAFSAILAPGQGWAFDLVHKGSPDENQEQAVARTTDFVFAFYTRAIDGAREDDRAGRLGAGGLPGAVKAIQAYALGHLCHIVGDVISHPYVNDVEWHQGTSSRQKFSHAGGEGSMDASVARRVLLRDSTREGQAWEVWWPTVDEVPDAFFRAYADALDFTYQARTLPPAHSFGGFLERFRDLGPPAVDADFVRDGYHLYRNGILGVGYGFGQWKWVAVLFPLLLPIVAAIPLAATLPRTSLLFRSRGTATDEEEDAAVASLLALPLALASPVLLAYGAWALSLTHLGVETRSTLGMLSLAISTVLSLLYFLDLGLDFHLKPWQRWLFFFVLPLAAATAFLVTGITDLARQHRTARGGATLLYAAPVFYFAFFFLLMYGPWFAGRRDLLDHSDARLALVLIVTIFWALALFLILAVGLAKTLRDARIPEEPEPFPLAPHFVRLFDDATFFRDGEGRRFFPAAGRALLKLWWDGEGDLHLRSRRYQLEFSFDGTTVAQLVPAPLVPMTPAEYGLLLTATVRDRGGATGHLKTAVAFPDDLAVQLPAGATFADHGDDLEAPKDEGGEDKTLTVEQHVQEAAKFQKLGTTAAKAFVLHHAPKPAQAIRFGAFGPVPPADEAQVVAREAREGYHYVADGSDDVLGETLMDYAGDVAAIVCLGAVTELAESRIAPSLLNRRSTEGAAVPAEVGPVAQVFRNWCLDRRRVNEWRMMVAGGALSEKGGHPERPDPAMPRPMDIGWRSDPAVAGGERVVNALGWVPLLRQWIGAVATGGDPLDETVRPNGFKNSELSQALAFLFDLPQPVRLAP